MNHRLADRSRDSLAELIERLPSRDAVARAVGVTRSRRSILGSNLVLIGGGVLLGSAITLLLAPMIRDRLEASPRSRHGGDGRDLEESVLTEM